MAPRRAVVRRTNANAQLVSATIERRTAAQNGGRKQSIRLTVKAPPSKLRQALHQDDNSPRDDFDASESEPPVRAPRSTRNINKVVDPDSDGLSEEDEQNGEEMEQDEDEDSEDDDDDDEQGDDDDAEGEDDDDIDAELLGAEDSEGDTPAPTVPSKANRDKPPRPLKITAKGTVTIKPPPPVKSVEEREKELEGDSSDLEDDDEEDENENDDQDEDQDEAEADSDEDMADVDEHGREISGTPDPSKLTRRQRATVDEMMDDGSLLALSNEAQKKKYITAEEHATRRLEMARRRRDLSEKKNEEEKVLRPEAAHFLYLSKATRNSILTYTRWTQSTNCSRNRQGSARHGPR